MVVLSEWFFGKDLVIDFVSIIVLLVLVLYVSSYYRINKSQKQYRLLIISFALLALSFAFKIVSHVVIYYTQWSVQHINIITIVHEFLESAPFIVFWGIILYRSLSLLAYYIFFSSYDKNRSRIDFFLVLYLLVILGFLSKWSYYLFHVTALIIILLIVRKIWLVYRKNNDLKSGLLALSFATLMLSQVLFIFMASSTIFYVVAELIQLAGFVLLLYLFIKVLKDAKKKRPH